jgi:hypothetical protein
MRYALLQKSTGAYYLALWNDTSIYKLATQSTPGWDIYPQNVPVTLAFSAPQTFTVYAPNDSTGVNPTNAYTISTTPLSIKLELPTEALLIKIGGD